MSHYFDSNPESPHEIRQITWQAPYGNFRFTTDASCFSKKELDYGSRLLIEGILKDWGFRPKEADQCDRRRQQLYKLAPVHLVDLGCGYGPVATILAANIPQASFLSIDINGRALDLAKKNFARNVGNSAQDRAYFLQADGLASPKDVEAALGHPFPADQIYLNPPIRAGKAVMYRLFAEAICFLKEGGSPHPAFFIVQNTKQGLASSKKEISRILGEENLAYEEVVLDRSRGFHVVKYEICPEPASNEDRQAFQNEGNGPVTSPETQGGGLHE